MNQGITLNIGLNFVDPNHYGGWNGELAACEFDAADMHAITKAQGFQGRVLLREAATRTAVISEIRNAAKTLDSKGIFCITYSGHGGQLPDLNSDEDDAIDETWCLFDGELIDDELQKLWATFKAGTRILVISDSCHSGTITKMAMHQNLSISPNRSKNMPREIAARTYMANREFYDSLLLATNEKTTINASVKLISGCQDNQLSYDGTFNGQFTAALKDAWNGGKFSQDYYSFHQAIVSRMKPIQTPNLFNIGAIDSSFDHQKPFSL